MNYKKQIQEHVAAAVEQGEWIGRQVGLDAAPTTPNPAGRTIDVGDALDLMAKRIDNARQVWAEQGS